MDIPPEFKAYFDSIGFKSDGRTLMEDVADFEKDMMELHASLKDPKQKQEFGVILQQLHAARQEAEKVVPKALQNMKADCEKLQAEALAEKGKIEQLWAELQAKLAEAEAEAATATAAPAAAAAAAAPAPSIDPTLGAALTASLLGRFGKKPQQPEAPLEDAGSVADAWVEPNQEPPHGEAAHKPAQKPPAEKPKTKTDRADKPKSDDDIWEGLSRLED
jgi:hypothetical protein